MCDQSNCSIAKEMFLALSVIAADKLAAPKLHHSNTQHEIGQWIGPEEFYTSVHYTAFYK